MARATIHRIPVGKTAAPRRAPARRKEVPWVHPADIDGATLERARDLIEQGRVTVRALSQLDCHVHVPGRYADATVIAVVLNVAAGYGHVRVTNGSASGQVAPLTMDGRVRYHVQFDRHNILTSQVPFPRAPKPGKDRSQKNSSRH